MTKGLRPAVFALIFAIPVYCQQSNKSPSHGTTAALSQPVASPTCDASGPSTSNSFALSTDLGVDGHAYLASGLCKLTDDDLKFIVFSPGMLAMNHGQLVYVGFQRKKGDDYSKVRVFIDSVSDSPATTDRFIERVASNPFAQIVYSRDDADLVLHVYATENTTKTLYTIAVNSGVPAKWLGKKDETFELFVTTPGIGVGRDSSSAVEDVYSVDVFRTIERQHKALLEWEKTGSTGLLFAQ
jgi:hypothetical protein